MQYEAPATQASAHAHAHHAPVVDAHAHAGHAPAAEAHAGHGDHMGHDMSDPGMAAAMERDMRNKFLVALALTIPTVLYSPMGMSLLGVRLPTFGLDMNLIMLVLTTPVVFYAGRLFIVGAYHSLRLRTLNMSVLIATGVLAAYVFSIVLMFLGGETFFEAAAMLVTFVLFGHWMEMRSRRCHPRCRACSSSRRAATTARQSAQPQPTRRERRHRPRLAGGPSPSSSDCRTRSRLALTGPGW